MVTARYAQEVGKASLGDSRDSDRAAVLTGRLQTYVADSAEPSVQEMLAAIYAMTPEEWERSTDEALRSCTEELANANRKRMPQSGVGVWRLPATPTRLPQSLHPARRKE